MDRASINERKETIRALTSARVANKRNLERIVKDVVTKARRREREEIAHQRQELIKENAKKREEKNKSVQLQIDEAELRSSEVLNRLTAMRTLLIDSISNPTSHSPKTAALTRPTIAPFKPRAKKPKPARSGTPPAPPITPKPQLEDFSPVQIPGTLYTPDDLKRRKEQSDSSVVAFYEALEKYEAELADYHMKLQLFEQTENEKKVEFESAVQRYQSKIDEEKRRYEKKRDAELARWKTANKVMRKQRLAFASGQPEAVTILYSSLLNSLEWPVNLKGARVAFSELSSQLVVELLLPSLDEAVPTAASYRYSQREGRVIEKLATIRERKTEYLSFVSQVVLRVAHEVFQAESSEFVSTVVISGMVEAIDPRTGKLVRPCLVTLRVSRDDFLEINLKKVDPVACLISLKAAVSRSPEELIAVKPIVEFDMVDPRFVKEASILTELDSRPNLMELTPSEFESLVTNLFENMGLETRLTQASRDGGVDCVAWDTRPIFGGKVIIQAKRYKNTVGPSAVRDLFGAMHNEGATKGILITTSGYGPSSYEFADNKPLELLDGANLLYLLKEHANVDAKIEVPDDWVDPIADGGGDF